MKLKINVLYILFKKVNYKIFKKKCEAVDIIFNTEPILYKVFGDDNNIV